MRGWVLVPCVTLALLLGGCARSDVSRTAAPPPEQTWTSPSAAENEAVAEDAAVTLVVAPSLQGRVDEARVRDAFRRVVAQGERDFGIRPVRTVTIFIDPDSAIGLEDALGLSAKYAIHLRAGRTGRLDVLLPLMMHEYMHVLQYQTGRLRPQWWIEGQADHQAQRVLEPGRAAQNRDSLFRQLAGDVKSGKAPPLAQLRGSGGWDEYVKRSGAGRAYGWGHAAVAFIEDGWGYDAVVRIITDTQGPNTFSSFDAAVQRETGLDPAAFESALHAWLLQQR